MMGGPSNLSGKELTDLNDLMKKYGSVFFSGKGLDALGKSGGMAGFLRGMLGGNKEIEEKQRRELERLLELFNKDPWEALKFAPQVNSPYQNRGGGIWGGDSLPGNNTDFSLSGLGGGGSAGYFNAGSKYHVLMQKYREAARMMMDRGEYRRAAYIYSKLLGDFNAAANALRKGKFFREAAELYVVHIKNDLAAAECYEEGGMYLDAIPLYEKLEYFEKTGDLYEIIGQRKNALHFYEKTLENHLANGKFLKGTDLLLDKMDQRPRAKELLLEGWENPAEGEACLKRLFDLKKEDKDKDRKDLLQDVFDNKLVTPRDKEFLHVLIYLNRGVGDQEMLPVCRELAYQILHRQSVKGDVSSVHYIRSFFKTDRLMGSDSSRFAKDFLSSLRKSGLGKTFEPELLVQLSGKVKWRQMRHHAAQQFQAIGTDEEGETLYIARWTAQGYYSQHALHKGNSETLKAFGFIPSSLGTNQIFLRHPEGATFEESTLPSGGHFWSGTKIKVAYWLPKEAVGATQSLYHRITALVQRGGVLFLYDMDVNGKPVSESALRPEGTDDVVPALFDEGENEVDLIYRNGYFHAHCKNLFFRIAPNGETRALEFGTAIHKIKANAANRTQKFLVYTDSGCAVVRPQNKPQMGKSNPFGQGLDIVDMTFANNFIVLAAKNEVEIYAESKRNNTPQFAGRFRTKDTIAAIVEGPKRNQVSVLTEAGSILTVNLEKD